MKKKILIPLFFMMLAFSGFATCSQAACPGAGTICCTETVTVAWGAYSYTVTQYTTEIPPVIAPNIT